MDEKEMWSLLETVHHDDKSLHEKLEEIEFNREDARQAIWSLFVKERGEERAKVLFEREFPRWDQLFDKERSLALSRHGVGNGRSSENL